MNILMLLSNPFMVDPRVYKEAKSLVDAGHNVTVIVWDRKNEYDDESLIDKVKIFRVKNKGLLKIFPHDLFRNPIWWRKSYKIGLNLYYNGFKFDVVHCHDLDTLQTGVWLKKKLKIKLVYDAHEIFGYMVLRTMPKFVSKFAFSMEKKLVRFVDYIITAEDTYIKYFKSLGCKNVISLMNCKDIIIKEYQQTKNKVFTIVYIGVLNKSRFFPECLDVIGNIKNVKFVIAGKKENLYDVVKQKSLEYDNIDFLGPITYDKVIPTTLKSDVVLCMIYPNDINNKIASANKQFEAMVCGRPIICTKDTRSGDITNEEKCGLVIDFNKKNLENAIIKLRDNQKICEELGRNALKAAINKYNWKSEEKKLINLYKSIKEL